MTKDKLDDLIERARKYIGKDMILNLGVDPVSGKNRLTPHQFTGIGRQIMTQVLDESENYEVYGILQLNDSKYEKSLLTIVNYFEKEKSNVI